MNRWVVIVSILLVLIAGKDAMAGSVQLGVEQANRLAALPLQCIETPFPYKSGHVIAKPEDLALPQAHHPAFYGCFDWHSAVHGHWSLVYLMKRFSDLAGADRIRAAIGRNITAENIAIEIDYFSMNKQSAMFERTYGWAWLLELAEELYTWKDDDAAIWYGHLKPLAELIGEKYIEYLPKLVYPIRVGEHTNTAFGLTFAYDYAITVGNDALRDMIAARAREFYLADTGCPIDWEPSGHDFLSPCLQELDIMRRILSRAEFSEWAPKFLDGLGSGDLKLTPGEVRDRSDGKLVHLDGLNFSRAWCLYPLASQFPFVRDVADTHLSYSLANITDGDYAGEHWLASFALYALKTRDEATDAAQ